MKKFHILTLNSLALAAVALTALTGCGKNLAQPITPPESVRSYVIGVSPQLSELDRATVWKEVGRFVLETAQPGDDIRVFDALNLHEITRFQIPNEVVMAHSANARVHRLKNAFGPFEQFIKSPPALAGAAPGAVLEPQFLDLASRDLRPPGKPLTVVIIGSVFYIHPHDLTWNFDPDRWPTDGHLAAPYGETPFSTSSRATALEGVSIYHAYLHDNFVNEEHKSALLRWWTVWAASQKGALAEPAADLGVILASASTGATRTIIPADADRADDKVAMVQLRKPPGPGDRWITEANVPITKEPPRNPIVQGVKIAIRWKTKADFDLYCRPAPEKEELYYKHPKSPEGIHEKEFAAPAGINGFETITFFGPVDLRQATAAINLYSGSVPDGAEVEVRMLCDGNIYSRIVKFAAITGNRGATKSSRIKDAHWAVLDLLGIVGLPPARTQGVQFSSAR